MTNTGQGRPATAGIATTVTLEDYLAVLYPHGTEGDLLALVLEPFSRTFGKPSNLPDFAAQIRRLDAKGHDVFLAVNTVDGTSIRSRGTSARGTEAEVVSVVALVADVDAGNKEGHNYPSQKVVLDALADMPLAPSMIVRSGRYDGGIHAYWLSDSPFIISGDEDRKRIKSISTRWQRLLKAMMAPYEVDSTFDLVRVLRPVGTINYKYRTAVLALEFNPERRYTVEDIEAQLPAPPPPVKFTPISGIDATSVVGRARAYIAKIPGAISGQNGHDATFHVACVLVGGFALSVDEALPLLSEWNATCEPPWSDRELLHKLQGAVQRTDERGYLLGAQMAPTVYLPAVNRLVLAQSEAWL
jgi:hypothetical protein